MPAILKAECASSMSISKRPTKLPWFASANYRNPVVPFVPTDISSLVGWMSPRDLSTITMDGSNLVSQWNSKATVQVRAFQQATGANKFLYVASSANLNNKPAMRLGPNTFMTPTSSPVGAGTSPTFIGVVSFSTAATRMMPIGGNGVTTHYLELGTQFIEFGTGAMYADFNVTAPALNTPYFFICQFTGNPVTATCTRNGTALASTGTNMTTWSSFDIGTLGRRGSSGEFPFLGDWGDWFFFNAPVTGTDLTNMISYVTTAYGPFA